jgi:hypothetical protein
MCMHILTKLLKTPDAFACDSFRPPLNCLSSRKGEWSSKKLNGGTKSHGTKPGRLSMLDGIVNHTGKLL